MPERTCLSSDAVHFTHSVLVFNGVRRPIMPDALILHVADSLPFDRLGNNCKRKTGSFGTHSVVNHLLVVTVDRAGVPPKCLKLWRHWENVRVARTDGRC